MYTVWHVDKYKITFKLVINSGRNSRGPVPGRGPAVEKHCVRGKRHVEDLEINGKINFTSEFFIGLTVLIFMQVKTLKCEVWFRSNFLNTEIAKNHVVCV